MNKRDQSMNNEGIGWGPKKGYRLIVAYLFMIFTIQIQNNLQLEPDDVNEGPRPLHIITAK